MSKQQNFKFQNLQPIAYLQNFNKMVENDIKNPMKTKKSQLRVFSLSKFPLPDVYRKMQGIFEAGTKKKDVTNHNIKSKEDVQDQEFLSKHKSFMTKAIKKIISDNDKQQQNLEQYKKQYIKKSPGEFVPLKSQFKSKFYKDKLTEHNTEQLRSKIFNNNNIQSQTNRAESESQSDNLRLTHLQKFQQERLQSLKNARRQKIKIIENNKVKDFLDSRRNFMSERKSRKSSRGQVNYNTMSPKDKKKKFIQDTLKLQVDQNKIQMEFAQKVEKQIKNFHSEADDNIKRVRSEKFW